ncbi:uncharacterized protein THITE_2113579 [Thermothielavioides terrestris NRRL 8126]|uniref:Uncharacterized protein n=1 Tax=Thermothielavioides terrestris (strain ATCC 38088 / NRRL 8126) TaxID=578455 RepID=G2R3C3_THETT|nr:uncharacterized protein THITE_2113579 [Thermothielavioides terrestris NRRL 8126]AEO65934.1 hypothetical protein THITE_2113579 [Thermothielavioides terrestris NRRL 8126]
MVRTTRSSAKRDFQPESSWRMVEGGENDSFDTSILHDDDEEFIISSGSDPSQPAGSQPFSIGGSQPWSIGGSQDESIENFLNNAEEDEQVLLRSPFRPSVPQSVRQSSRENMRHRSPEPEFYMPKVDVESPRRPTTRSSTTVRAADPTPPLPGLRRRQGAATGSPSKRRRAKGKEEAESGPANEQASFSDRISASLPGALLDALGWAFGVVGLALRYAQKPIAILVSLYLTFGGVIVLQNMATKSLYTSLSPLCRVPGVSWMELPFCPDLRPTQGAGKEKRQPVEFESLMSVQDQFERVLEKSAQGVSLPMEMKRSEASIRDLRTMVRYSTLRDKDELVLEFDGFIETARSASSGLQNFNTHVGSAVDWVISMNRWTSRHLDSLEEGGNKDEQGGLLGAWTGWLFAPFQPAVFSERLLLDRYVEHTALVSDKIAGLILEAQAVLRTLSKAEDHLSTIYDFVTRTQKTVQSRKDEILWTLWTLVGANNQRLNNLNSQLSLLRQVNAQRSDAVKQVSALIVELEKIQAGLGDLRDRVAAPGLIRGQAEVPLSVHIETINRGVERLEAARSRIRAEENERIREVLARGKREERLIEQA